MCKRKGSSGVVVEVVEEVFHAEVKVYVVGGVGGEEVVMVGVGVGVGVGV